MIDTRIQTLFIFVNFNIRRDVSIRFWILLNFCCSWHLTIWNKNCVSTECSFISLGARRKQPTGLRLIHVITALSNCYLLHNNIVYKLIAVTTMSHLYQPYLLHLIQDKIANTHTHMNTETHADNVGELSSN